MHNTGFSAHMLLVQPKNIANMLHNKRLSLGHLTSGCQSWCGLMTASFSKPCAQTIISEKGRSSQPASFFLRPGNPVTSITEHSRLIQIYDAG